MTIPTQAGRSSGAFSTEDDPLGTGSVFQPAVPGMYLWVTVGLLIAGVAAWSFHRLDLLDASGWIGYLVVVGSWIICLVAVTITARRIASGVTVVAVLGFNIWTGATAAHLLGALTEPVLLPAIGSTMATLVVMGIFAAWARRNVDGWKSAVVMVLAGLALSAAARWVMGPDSTLWFYIAVLTLILLGLVFLQCRKLVEGTRFNNRRSITREALRGSVAMYLGAFSIFLTLFMVLVLQDNAAYRRRLELQRDSVNTMPPPPPPTGIGGV